MKSSEPLKLLRKHGCYYVKQAKGSHEWWFSPITQKHFLVTNHGSKEVAKGTENKIIKEAISVQIDLKQLFDYYKEINVKAISRRVGINATLLSQYVNGKKEPSEKQQEKILKGIRSWGKELQSLELT